MILPVTYFGNPVLRKQGARIEAITEEIRRLISDLFETMQAYKGIGLAAQQVGIALKITVIDVRDVKDRPSTLEWDGQRVEVRDFMPLVLINPEVTPAGPPASGPEGCLSFPEIFADITRPETVDVTALNEKGVSIRFRCGGLLARAVQHETDHLNGILFIDRMDKKTKDDLRPELDFLQAETKAALEAAKNAGDRPSLRRGAGKAG